MLTTVLSFAFLTIKIQIWIDIFSPPDKGQDVPSHKLVICSRMQEEFHQYVFFFKKNTYSEKENLITFLII